ncbi:Alanine--tRNA ligase cytoplasmic [Fasciola gigantica]|uniref:alanine--tRNA ligase n=1 Tax=Fasciola gigantica TaxID=46835 RepID=A0A504Y8K6_FASGI|nr:Alanine--tRNA ligase cytoplasmic [Fasciola gigantica]
MPFGNATALLVSNRVFALKRLRNSVPWWLLNGFLHPRIRLLATVPSSGPDLQITGQCIGEVDETVPRHVPLASSIRLANATADDLRLEFLAYFQSKRHTIVAPSSIFPKTHEGSYFVNAGMNQFKSLILGQKSTASSVQFTRLSRATNSQPCIRLGGRHDDLNDVGYDRQHHTMFEMLGSWSFGDYYKEKACHFMWDFVTKVLGLPKNALYVTYFGGCPEMGLPADDVTRDIWLRLGVMDQKLLPFGIAHNFWRAGNASGAGLCGPSTELHVDFHSLQDADGLQCARCLINTTSPQGATSTYDTDVFQPLLEFIQAKATTSSWTPPAYAGEFIPFCRQPSQTETENQAAVEEEKSAVTTTVRSFSSLFRKLLPPKRARRPFCANQNCSEQTGERVNLHSISASVTGSSTEDHNLLDRWHRDTAYRLMVDHSRALAHALSDGLLPGRQGLGLKLRQLIHRAARASVLTGLDPLTQSRSVLGSLVAEMEALVTKEMLAVLPRLEAQEEAFHQCLDENPDGTRLSPEQVSRLLNGNYGTPVSWDMLCAQSHWFGLCVPEAPLSSSSSTSCTPASSSSSRANTSTPAHQSQSRPDQSVAMAEQLYRANFKPSDDTAKYNYERQNSSLDSASGYDIPTIEARLLAVFVNDAEANRTHLLRSTDDVSHVSLNSNQILSGRVGLVFDQTNFFASAGGQDSDKGVIRLSSSVSYSFVTRFHEMIHCALLNIHSLHFGQTHAAQGHITYKFPLGDLVALYQSREWLCARCRFDLQLQVTS